MSNVRRRKAGASLSIAISMERIPMFRSLRKGTSSVYLQHENTGHSIGAKQFEVQLVDGTAILRFTLSPVDGNQRHDESYLHDCPLRSIDLDDSYIINQLRNYLKAQRKPVANWEVKIVSRGKELSFPVAVTHRKQATYESLHFSVSSSDA
jgi:hypothetical protein